MLASLGKDKETADIEGLFQNKLAIRAKKDNSRIEKSYKFENEDKENMP